MNIQVYYGYGNANQKKLRDLIEEAFQAEMIANYFEITSPYCTIVARDKHEYVGTCILEEIPHMWQVLYMNNLAVKPDYQHRGIGRKLLLCALEESGNLIWKTKKGRDSIGFYSKFPGIIHREFPMAPGYHFFRTINVPRELILPAFEFAAGKPETFLMRPAAQNPQGSQSYAAVPPN